MKSSNLTSRLGAAALAMSLALLGLQAQAGPHHGKTITLIQLSDVHGNLVPHAGILKTADGERYVTQGGGLAKAKTLIDEIRADNPASLLLAVGDTVHGTPEVMFTVGDAIMPALNAMGIDAYTPGNWEFGYGPAVFRNRFASFGPKPPLPANIRVMADAYDGPGVTPAAFPTIAINLYNDADSAPLPPQLHNKRVLPPYKLFDVDGVRVAVIGITAAIVPQQPKVFNIGLRFTQGIQELPGIIEEAKMQGATVIVVQSELGLAQNLEIGRRFEDVDVVLSAHTHEVTLNALVADEHRIRPKAPRRVHYLEHDETVVVETTEDLFLGRLDLVVRGGQVTGFEWNAIPVDDEVPEDPEIKALVDHAEAPFIGDTVVRHTFMPGGYCPGNDCGDITTRGLQLTESLDTVVGHTEVILHRGNALEDEINNFIADAIFNVANTVVPTGVDLSMTNGFRFGHAILSADVVAPGQGFRDGRNPGDITLRDLYTLFPITPAVAVAEFSGKSILDSMETVLTAVYDRNPFLQRGGWYVGMANMTQKIDLDNRPFSSSGGRIVETTIGGVKLDPSKRYLFASCFPHGEALDRICRTSGGTNHMFFELADADDYRSGISLVPPLNSEGIVNGPRVKQVAPDRFVHAVHLMRLYLDSLPGRTVTGDRVAVGRVQTVDSTQAGNPPVPAPVSEIDPTLIQPPEGAGPKFYYGLLND
ncbi:bifunctional metallophosphatase/5'-nucleotidase [Thiohalobacter sp.]|uniref:bifunctional metallophosphatase/5'-nucleotidase n=1 Tax=Thiohalobacter sp. TaxID=2025948 RepID=UPI00261CEBA9|nr:bifunctional metallophosphatase/5'-nucleotidase [Thiohalobacter sp.]